MSLQKNKKLNIDHQKRGYPGTIAFIHGNSCSLKHFDDFFENYNGNHSLLRFDLPGHGTSYQTKHISGYSFENYRKEIINLLQQINDDLLLVGHSMGGHLAIEVTSELKKLKGLVIMGAPPVKKPLNMEEAFNPVPELQNMFTAKVPRNVAEKMFEKVCSNNSDGVIESILEDFYGADPKTRTAIGHDLINNELLDEATIFCDLKLKKFVVIPEDDLTPNAEYIRYVAKVAKAKVFNIPHCGHYPSLEQPEKFTEIIQTISEEVFGT